MGAAASTLAQDHLAVVLPACIIGALVTVKLLRLGDAWRLRTLPGPPALPILGNLADIIATPGGFAAWREKAVRQWGRVYKIWVGSTPTVIVTDVDIMRKVASTSTRRPDFDIFSGMVGENFYVELHGLVSLSPEKHGNKFRGLRKAFDMAVLSPASLAAHEPMLRDCTERLIARLGRSADSGEPVDMVGALSDMTMLAIGFAAFGVDLHCTDEPSLQGNSAGSAKLHGGDVASSDWLKKPGTVEFGRGLTAAARAVFRTADAARGSLWKLPPRFIPELSWPLRHLGSLLPDRAMREETQARSQINEAVRVLLRQYQDYQTAQKTQDGSALPPAMSERGFLAKLLSVAEAEGLSDLDIIAQAYTMLLAGYETTATALSDTLFLLLENPKQMARLQTEVDSQLRGKAPSAEDMERLPFLKAVIDESLRLLFAADVVLRTLDRDMVVQDGKVIPRDIMVFLCTRSVHLDPSIWPRAEEFLPERWLQGHDDLAPRHPHAYNPFGLSARMCPGYKFALLEARLALARLVQSFTFSPAPGLPRPKWNSGIVYAPDCLWVTVNRTGRDAQAEPSGPEA